jgi:hypothetical protein
VGITLLSIAPKAQLGPLTIIVGGNGTALLLNGQQLSWKESSFRITRRLNSSDSASFQLEHYAGDDYPEEGDEVVMIWEGTRIFGGYVLNVEEDTQDGQDDKSLLTVNLTGYDSLFDNLVVAKLYTVPIGGLPQIILYDIWATKLAPRGITYNYGAGPSVLLGDTLFKYVTVREAINTLLAQSPDWSIWIDENKQLRFERTNGAGHNAPFIIEDGLDNWDSLKVTKDRSRFRNRQWVLPSKDLKSLFTDTHTGDGSTTAFSTTYALATKPIILVDGVAQVVTELGNWIAGYQCWYVPGGIGVFFVAAPGSTLEVDIEYPSPFPLAVSAQDDASIADVGLYEASYQAKDIIDVDSAQALAQGLLDLNKQDSVTIELVYNSDNNEFWLKPGMSLSIDKTIPNFSGDATVQEVSSAEQDLVLWRHTVTLAAGPGDVTDSTTENQILVSSRVPSTGKTVIITLNLGEDITGLTNPGVELGISTTFTRIPVILGGCVLDSWSFIDPVDPPTGAALIADIQIDGTSIFLGGDDNKPTIPDGDTTEQAGFNFATPNQRFIGGEIVRTDVLQIGSTTPGKNAVLILLLKG